METTVTVIVPPNINREEVLNQEVTRATKYLNNILYMTPAQLELEEQHSVRTAVEDEGMTPDTFYARRVNRCMTELERAEINLYAYKNKKPMA